MLLCIAFIYSVVVRESHTLQSLPPIFQHPTHIIYSYHIIIDHVPNAVLLHSCDYFVTSNLYFLISTFSTDCPVPSPLATTCIYVYESIHFVYLVCSFR